MIMQNIILSDNVNIEPSSSVNNVELEENVKVAKRCSIFGSPENLVTIGKGTYIGMNTVINGFHGKINIGNNVSIAQSVNIMADSGPNASLKMQKYFPLDSGDITIGDNCWIGANVVIMPNVHLGEFCVVAANSFVNESFESYSVIGGNPAKLIRKLEKFQG